MTISVSSRKKKCRAVDKNNCRKCHPSAHKLISDNNVDALFSLTATPVASQLSVAELLSVMYDGVTSPVSSKMVTEQRKKTIENFISSVEGYAYDVLDEYGDKIEFSNHSGTVDKGFKYLTLNDMSDGLHAKNNCWIVTSELIETLSSSALGGRTVDMVQLSYKNNGDTRYHAAVFTTDSDDNVVVVDYTARQFDENLPFPYVDTAENWCTRLSDIIGHKFSVIYGE